MVMLLGVCLVVSGDFGNRLLFRYPPLKIHTNQSTAAQPKDATSNANHTGRPAPAPINSSSSPTPAQPAQSLATPASASRPVSRLTSTGPITDTAALQRLNDLDDLDPDDMPPPLPAAVLAQAAANSTARRRSLQPPNQHSASASASSLSSAAAALSTLSALPGASSTTAMPLSEKEDIWGMPLYEFTRLFSPLSSHLASSLFDVAVNSVRFLSFPVRLPSESRHEMTMFNVVFVLKANVTFALNHTSPSQQSSHAAQPVASLLLELYSAILIQLSRALEHEQKRCGFLSYHSSLMTQLRDRYIRGLQAGTEAEKGGLAAVLVRESLLADHLYRLYSGLVRLERYYYAEEGEQGELQEGGEKQRRRRSDINKANTDTLTHVHLLVNDWLHLHCTLAPSAAPRPSLSSPASPGLVTSATAAPLSIRPYQTLLLTTSQQSLLASLPPDSSPVLARVIVHINPIHSFLSLASSLSLPLSSLLLLAHHLVQWGKARVIDTLQDTDTFVVSSSSPPLTASLLSSFSAAFPASSLPLFLSALHPPRPLAQPLSRLSTAAKQRFMKQLVWALERGIVDKLDTALLYRGGDPAGAGVGGLLGGDRSEWSEADWVLHLSRYGDGKHTLTEIVWLERAYLTREELMRLFEQHQDQFLCIQLQPT